MSSEHRNQHPSPSPRAFELTERSMPGITDLMFPSGLRGVAARKLGDLFMRTRAELEQSTRASGVSFAQMHLLVGFAVMGKCRLVDLVAVHSGSTKQNLAALIAKLVKAGLVVSEPDDRDGRSKLLSLSPEGEKMVREHAPSHRDALGRLFASLNEEELTNLVAILDKLAEGQKNTEEEA